MVENLTLDFSHDLKVVRLSSVSGLMLGMESA